MKKTILALAISFGITSTTQAATCLVPEPALCAVTVVGMILMGTDGDEQLQAMQISADDSALRAIASDAKQSRLQFVMGNYDRYVHGFSDVIQRYENNQISGDWSLEWLMDFRPSLFADLDLLASIIEAHVETQGFFGPKHFEDGQVNWARYAKLAKEGQVVYHNFFVD